MTDTQFFDPTTSGHGGPVPPPPLNCRQGKLFTGIVNSWDIAWQQTPMTCIVPDLTDGTVADTVDRMTAHFEWAYETVIGFSTAPAAAGVAVHVGVPSFDESLLQQDASLWLWFPLDAAVTQSLIHSNVLAVAVQPDLMAGTATMRPGGFAAAVATARHL